VVIKPSEFTSASTLEFARLFEEAGFPPGVVNVVTGFGKDVGATLVDHPLVAKITFTGADATGRAINEAAARQFKHVSLELGGKSPNIIFADAKLDDAVNGAVSGIFAATGQTCIAGSRLLVQGSVYDEVVERLLALARTARMGDPMQMDTQVGPVTTRPQYDKVLSYIEIAKAEGARLLLGGGPADDKACGSGWFVQPTIFGDVDNRMRIAQEEVFGPVLSIIRFTDEDDAVRIANDVRFGLGSGVWTQDMGRAFRMSERLQAGMVWVNTYRAVSFMSPFGGYKDSGLGRENGMDAINEYLQTKSVWIKLTSQLELARSSWHMQGQEGTWQPACPTGLLKAARRRFRVPLSCSAAIRGSRNASTGRGFAALGNRPQRALTPVRQDLWPLLQQGAPSPPRARAGPSQSHVPHSCVPLGARGSAFCAALPRVFVTTADG
jgi:acyl-CoA reductase-like NAD-dependent aldehyde dehydrogenase